MQINFSSQPSIEKRNFLRVYKRKKEICIARFFLQRVEKIITESKIPPLFRQRSRDNIGVDLKGGWRGCHCIIGGWLAADGRCCRVLLKWTFLEANKRTFKTQKMSYYSRNNTCRKSVCKVFSIYKSTSFNLDEPVRNCKVCQGKPLRC